MHNAPSVTYPVGRSLFLGRLLALAWSTGACVAIFGEANSGTHGGRTALTSGGLLLVALLARRFWRRLPTGLLRWDGHGWQGPQATGLPAGLSVHLDLQRHLLVRLHHTSARSQWLWLEAASDPVRWDDLRRAVYSRAMPDPQRDAANP